MAHNHCPVGSEPQLYLTPVCATAGLRAMEEGAPLDPSSGGTPTAMVAVPMLNSALGQRLSIFGGTGVGTKMEASIHLRAKDFAAHERWLAEFGGRDHQQRAGRSVGKPTASNSGGGGALVLAERDLILERLGAWGIEVLECFSS